MCPPLGSKGLVENLIENVNAVDQIVPGAFNVGERFSQVISEDYRISVSGGPQVVHSRSQCGHAVATLYGECIKRPSVADNRIGQVVKGALKIVGRVVKAREEASEPLRRVPCRFKGISYIVHLDAKSVQNYLLRLLCNGEVIERTVEGICLISGRLHCSINVFELKLKGFFYGF